MATTLLGDAPQVPPPASASVARRRPVRPWRVGRAPMAVLALIFFFGPNAARLAGADAEAFENRRLRTFPAASTGWGFLPGVDGWAVDHLPLRHKAVQAHRSVAQGVFDDTPEYGQASQTVLTGRDGWLFFQQDFAWRCDPVSTLDDIWSGTARLERLVRSAGARFVLVVVPDKSSVENATLPSYSPKKACAASADARLWSRLDSAPPPGYLDVRRELLRLRDERGHAYYQTDSHWTPQAQARYSHLLADRLDPGLWRDSRIEFTGPQPKPTDLTLLAGDQRAETVDGAQVRRDGVDSSSTVGVFGKHPLVHSIATSTAAPLYPGRTVLLGDSFSEVALSQVTPLFADLTYTHWVALLAAREAAQLLLRSQTVVVQVVQRHFGSGRATMFAPSVLDALERELARARATQLTE